MDGLEGKGDHAKMIIMAMVIMMIYMYKSINQESIDDCRYLIYFWENHISSAIYMYFKLNNSVLLVFITLNTAHYTCIKAFLKLQCLHASH